MASDIVITTAQLRGRPAPLLIKKATVEGMRKGSVVIDLAASTGGNCEVSVNEQTISYEGVTVVGDSILYDRMPQDASTLYGNNIHNFLKHIIREGAIDLNSEDEILSKSLISKKA
jgi:NAD(P) transhydrogenase subunit alpha